MGKSEGGVVCTGGGVGAAAVVDVDVKTGQTDSSERQRAKVIEGGKQQQQE